MKIATYNVNSIRIRLDAIISWLEKHQPDVLCIQETKCQNELFPLLVLQSTGYKVYYRGMKSYNGGFLDQFNSVRWVSAPLSGRAFLCSPGSRPTTRRGRR